jgi:hypothetical protein
MRKLISIVFFASLAAVSIGGCAAYNDKHDKGTDSEGMFGTKPELDQQEKEAQDSIKSHHQ